MIVLPKSHGQQLLLVRNRFLCLTLGQSLLFQEYVHACGATFVSACHKFFFSILPAHDIVVYVCVVYGDIHITHMHTHTYNISIKVFEFRQMHKHFRTVSFHILDLCRRI